ncbi:PEP-CTERM putative exosortase interaction domain-containing protein [Rivularia sp. PCC 7116]|uniref:ScyD/ScyE family protein n=1 Tax=Rivularia sp. PCC 7116 TaxID=373994 RepID=UPI00029F28AB|nr:ScyD/ScyE family protein [Rivularia sp. PCC 7116]AFY54437.1 PEP-CTERM putative exosortase interaction domain-containing protein [Rivularia sp. PCC 7116]
MKFKSIALTLFTVSIASILGTTTARAASLSVLADGLDNPRNFDFDSEGNIYLTTSGKGGDGEDGRCVPSPSSQFIPLCAGNTGSLLKIGTDGSTQTVIPDLASLALTPFGEQAAGPADLKFDDNGKAYLLMGYAGDPSTSGPILQTPTLGKLYEVDLQQGALGREVADFAQYEVDNNPDGTDIITNPYAMTIKDNTAFVVDGGANVIWKTPLDQGGIEKVAAFPILPVDQSELEFPSFEPPGEIPGGEQPSDAPGLPAINGQGGEPPSGPPPGGEEASQDFPITFQSVPTGITESPDGDFTVAEYSYFPYPEGRARLYSVDSDLNITETITNDGNGFTQLTGTAYDEEGNLYVLQHMNTSEWKNILQGGEVVGDISSSIIKVAADGTRETIWNGDGLEAASGLTYRDGALYTANRARLAEQGQLVKIDLAKGGDKPARVPEPASVLGLLGVAAAGATSQYKKRKRQEEKLEEILDKVEAL